MQVTNQPAASAAPTAAAVQPTNNAAPGQFASLLRQSQAPAAATKRAPAPATPPTAQSDSNACDHEADAAAAPEAPAGPQGVAKARPKSSDKAPAAKPAERGTKVAAPSDPVKEVSDPHEDVANKRSGEVHADPAPGSWLATLQRPVDVAAMTAGKAVPAQTSSAVDAVDAGDVPATATTPNTKSNPTLGAQDDTLGDPKSRAEAHKASFEITARQAPPSATDELVSLRAGKHAVEESQSPRSSQLESAPGLAAFNPAVGGTRELAAPLTVNLPTPLASPEFAQALGVQMSVLASGGVQRAELQLNPAEMGPVSVQIVIDGTTARVDFGADVAATRHAIEAGLPELAGALRDAGFTLTGGGVSQHSRGRGETRDDIHGAGAGAGAGQHVDTTRAEASARVLRRTVSAGGVDLYA